MNKYSNVINAFDIISIHWMWERWGQNGIRKYFLSLVEKGKVKKEKLIGAIQSMREGTVIQSSNYSVMKQNHVLTSIFTLQTFSCRHLNLLYINPFFPI